MRGLLLVAAQEASNGIPRGQTNGWGHRQGIEKRGGLASMTPVVEEEGLGGSFADR